MRGKRVGSELELSARKRTAFCLLAAFLPSLLLHACASPRRIWPHSDISVRGRFETATQKAGPARSKPFPRLIVAIPMRGQAKAPSRPQELQLRHGKLEPELLAVARGQELRIFNSDSLCHSFFSSSTGNAFKTPILQPSESAKLRLETPGLVQIYCSLHEGRQARVIVLPSPYFQNVDGQGHFLLRELPPGDYRLAAWTGERLNDSPRFEEVDSCCRNAKL